MSWDFHPTENDQALADMKPLTEIAPGAFAGMQWMPYQLNRGFAVAGRTLSMATATPFILADKVMGGTELQDKYFRDVHEPIYQRAVDYWTPNPKEVGTAARVVGDLLSTLPMAIAAPPLAIASAQMGTAEDLVRAGVSPGKAQAVGAIQGVGMGLGIWMPILGKNLWQRTVVGGAGFNMLQGAVSRGASGAILEDTPAEGQFKAFDGEALTLDVLLGLGFGAFTHINPEARAQSAEAWDQVASWAQRFSPSQKAAVATLREAQHLNVDSTPGKPVGHQDIEAHVNRMRTAIDQLANDKPVQVEDMPAPKMEPDPVREQENIQRTADMINIAERIREEEGLPRLDDLKSAFSRFRDWLIEVYKSAVNLNVTLSDEVRGVMGRMLDSQAAHPSEPPRAPAEGAGTPPPGKGGEAPAARSDLDQALAEGKPNLSAPRGLEHPDIRETLQDMAANDRLDSLQQIGEERFGEMLEDATLEDLPPTTENAFDSMTARRAYDLDLEAYEAAVDRYNVHEDDGLFMAEVRSIIHEAEQQRGAGSQDHPGGAAERGARPGEANPAAESAGQRNAPRDYVSTEAERIATDNPERRVHVGLDADDKPLTVTAREFLDNARKEADRIRQDANLFQIAGECLLSQL